MTTKSSDKITDGGSADSTLAAVLGTLAASSARLAALVTPLTSQELRQQAYPTEWSIADVLSHLGSGAVITRRRLDGEVDMQAIWDEWNAKDPEQQAADAVRADRELQARLATLSAEEQAGLRFSMGPMELDLSALLGMRLNEHALHTWDVAVTLEPSATVPPDAAELVVDNLAMVAGYAGKPTGVDRTITVRTAIPTRHFQIALRPDGVTLSPSEPVDGPDLELSAEAFIRLIYGRLDPAHSPTVRGDQSDLAELRRTFTGI